ETIYKVGCGGHGVRPIGERQARVVEKGKAGFGDVTISAF
ncbi:hypothetical protein L195_g049180, partial [Trifolium pratense]